MRDTETVASIVAGDPDGLATAYDRYADPLFTYCATLLGDTAEAADAVQDTFVIAGARLDGLHDPQRLRAWLLAVARGECLRVLRSKRRTQPQARDVTAGAEGTYGTGLAGKQDGGSDAVGTADGGDADSGDADGGNADGAGGGEEPARAGLRTLFDEACAGLGAGEREVIELRLRLGLKPGEVATVLGVSRSRAHTLLSRASDELETCLGALLVGRAGRDECAELGAMLTGWDGRLTAALSKRAGRHIEQCSACSARRAVELRPSALLELTPAAALAAGAAESFRRAAGAPAGLKAHTIALATERGAASAAHATAVLSRAGTFGRQGFPRPAHGVPGAAGARSRHSVRSSPQRQAAVAAAVVLAVGVAVAGFALSGGHEHLTPVADPRTPVSSANPTAATTTSAAATRATTPAAAASGRSPAARTTTPVAVTVTQQAVTTPAAVPTTATPSRTPSGSATATRSASPTVSPSQPAGTLRVFPGGGSLFLVPGGHGALLFLSASGGTVDWSVSVSGDPDHTITVSPATSGTLTAAHPRVTLVITASQNLSCGNGRDPCPAITIEPGGTVLTVTTSWRRHPFRHRRRPHPHDGAPAATVFLSSAP
jgi:RNA polymerase sigma factor (sigma-70 family)